MRTGVMNIIAFSALLVVGTGHLYFGWTKMAVFMLGLSAISLFFGAWDIWIYRRNLPPIAKRQESLSESALTDRSLKHSEVSVIAEPTTRKLETND